MRQSERVAHLVRRGEKDLLGGELVTWVRRAARGERQSKHLEVVLACANAPLNAGDAQLGPRQARSP